MSKKLHYLIKSQRWKQWGDITKIKNALKSNKDNEIKNFKMLGATQVRELLTNTFYEAKLKREGKMFFLATSSY
jgi:hypothetical protein